MEVILMAYHSCLLTKTCNQPTTGRRTVCKPVKKIRQECPRGRYQYGKSFAAIGRYTF